MGFDNHHDSLFRYAFTRLDVATAYLKAHLPAALVSRCDWSGLTVAPGRYVDPELQDLATDILYRIPLLSGGPPLLVYVLLEHQHRVELLMGFRLLRYLVRIWEGWLDDNGGKGPLPVIVPLVLYHGQRNWTARKQFQELFSEEAQELLGSYIPAFVYAVHDLVRFPDAQLHGEALGKLTLLLLKHGRSKTFWEVFPAWVGLLAAVAQNPGQGLEVVSALLRYVLLVGQDKPPDTVITQLREAVSPQTAEVIMGWAQQLRDEGHEQGLKKGIEQGLEQGIEQGLEQGIEQGLEQGRQEGLRRGQQALLARQLERRFGPLSEETVQKLAAADEEALGIWGERLLEAASLDAVFAADGAPETPTAS